MIKATELRLGSLLFPTTKLPPHFRMAVKITAIGNPIESNYIFATGNHVADEYGFNPIPLTEEWLTKLGFEKDYDETYTIQTGRQAFRICPAEDNYMLYQHDVGLRWCSIHDGPDHVHQLQNLYFALTGEELTLKESI